MNNRYICKAKRKDNGEWVEGVAIFADNKAFILNNAKVEFIKGFNENRLIFVLVEVIPETVRQCTGLEDKNGKWIFEGDVLGTDTVSGFVLYENGCFAFRWKNNDKYRADFYKNCILTNYARINELEVIGNIHDNPELLEV